jgi:hypothetical protein
MKTAIKSITEIDVIPNFDGAFSFYVVTDEDIDRTMFSDKIIRLNLLHLEYSVKTMRKNKIDAVIYITNCNDLRYIPHWMRAYLQWIPLTGKVKGFMGTWRSKEALNKLLSKLDAKLLR